MIILNTVDEPRKALGRALVKFGSLFPELIVISPDVGISTHAIDFKEKFPERYISCGIAEQNAFGVAAGLTSFHYIPVVALYAAFAFGKASDPIINGIAYPNLNVKIIGTHGGINVGPDGPTHQSIVDLAFFRAVPNMLVLTPSDSSEVESAVELALKHKGPVYIRLERAPSSDLDHPLKAFEYGKSEVIVPGSQVTIMAIGSMVEQAIIAAEQLKERGISVRVINMRSLKPIDVDLIKSAALETELMVTVEDHNSIGGLFSAVSEVVAGIKSNALVKSIAIKDQFAESGSSVDLRKKYGLTAEAIIEEITAYFEEK